MKSIDPVLMTMRMTDILRESQHEVEFSWRSPSLSNLRRMTRFDHDLMTEFSSWSWSKIESGAWSGFSTPRLIHAS